MGPGCKLDKLFGIPLAHRRIGPNMGVTRNASAYKTPSVSGDKTSSLRWPTHFSIASSMIPTCTTNPSQNVNPSMPSSRHSSDPQAAPDPGLQNPTSPQTTRFVHLPAETRWTLYKHDRSDQLTTTGPPSTFTPFKPLLPTDADIVPHFVRPNIDAPIQYLDLGHMHHLGPVDTAADWNTHAGVACLSLDTLATQAFNGGREVKVPQSELNYD